MDNKKMDKERSFSIELKSRANLKNVTLTDNSNQNAIVEGTIGKLERAQFVEDTVLEIVGKKGVIMVEINEDEINNRPQRR